MRTTCWRWSPQTGSAKASAGVRLHALTQVRKVHLSHPPSLPHVPFLLRHGTLFLSLATSENLELSEKLKCGSPRLPPGRVASADGIVNSLLLVVLEKKNQKKKTFHLFLEGSDGKEEGACNPRRGKPSSQKQTGPNQTNKWRNPLRFKADVELIAAARRRRFSAGCWETSHRGVFGGGSLNPFLSLSLSFWLLLFVCSGMWMRSRLATAAPFQRSEPLGNMSRLHQHTISGDAAAHRPCVRTNTPSAARGGGKKTFLQVKKSCRGRREGLRFIKPNPSQLVTHYNPQKQILPPFLIFDLYPVYILINHPSPIHHPRLLIPLSHCHHHHSWAPRSATPPPLSILFYFYFGEQFNWIAGSGL